MALHFAAEEGHPAALAALLRLPKIDSRAKMNGSRTALHLAAAKGHLACVNEILNTATGAFLEFLVNMADDDGKTALHLAAESEVGSGEVIGALVSHGADVNALANGKSALQLAAARRVSDPVVQELLVATGTSEDAFADLKKAEGVQKEERLRALTKSRLK